MSDLAEPTTERATATRRRRPQLRQAFPIVAQLRGYKRAWLPRDVTAGLAVASVALPIGVAYPAIAGLPPEVGLYASVAALVGYALFGSSRQLIVGPDAATLTVLAASLTQISAAGPDQRMAAAAAFSLAVGIFCLVAAACRLGFIANFLSRPVLTGYLCGVSLSLIDGQIERLTTVHVRAKGLLLPLIDLARSLDAVHLPTLAVGGAAFLLLRVLRRIAPRAPGPLVALALAIALSMVLDLRGWGVALLGPIAVSLPGIGVPRVPFDRLDDLALAAVGILVVGFGSGIVTARSFGARNRYRVDADRELAGFGAANIACGLVGGFPVTGADSRTAVNDAMGGRTQLVGLVAAAALVLVLTALTGVLQYLPIAVLGAVLASAAVDLIDIAELRRLWRVSRPAFAFAIIAMVGVVWFGVLKGVIVGIGATGVYLLARVSRPNDALLGRVPGRDGLYKLHREPRARPIPGLALYLVQGDLVFFNIDYVRDRIRWIIDRLPPATRWFVIDAEAVATIDTTAAAVLEDIRDECRRRGIRFGLADLHSQPRRILERAGVAASIGPDMLFDRVTDAVAAFGKTAAGGAAPPSEAAARS
ncbi:MAG TPA: SulP family inorganic anion transporter [Stellaceae bacterium]|nr:SulP family inorganic anion transporter [Stellaceae bacterium]